MSKTHGGKGSKPRPIDRKAWDNSDYKNKEAYKRAVDNLRYCHESGLLFWRNNMTSHVREGQVAGHINSHGYIIVTMQVNKVAKPIPAHRICFLIYYGFLPKYIDHVNGIKTDNRIINLRECTAIQNGMNRGISSSNTSGFTGVCYDKERSKWLASIRVNKKNIKIGRFLHKEDAIKARAEAEIKYFKEV
jgi:hypothetical protein